jgi:hypothetical protein
VIEEGVQSSGTQRRHTRLKPDKGHSASALALPSSHTTTEQKDLPHFRNVL